MFDSLLDTDPWFGLSSSDQFCQVLLVLFDLSCDVTLGSSSCCY